MIDTYVLDGETPVACDDLMQWGSWMQTASRTVRRTVADVMLHGKPVGQITVSTVFLGIDHALGEGLPILFETMVFGGPLDGEIERCGTWEGAEGMHEEMMERVKSAAQQWTKLDLR